MHNLLGTTERRDAFAATVARNLKGGAVSDEAMLAEGERLERAWSASRDPLARVAPGILGAARKLLAMRGEDETYESLCAAVDELRPRVGVV